MYSCIRKHSAHYFTSQTSLISFTFSLCNFLLWTLKKLNSLSLPLPPYMYMYMYLFRLFKLSSSGFQPVGCSSTQSFYCDHQSYITLDQFCSWLCDLTFASYSHLLKSCFDYSSLSIVSNFYLINIHTNQVTLAKVIMENQYTRGSEGYSILIKTENV